MEDSSFSLIGRKEGNKRVEAEDFAAHDGALYQGELKVLGMDPWKDSDRLMRQLCFLSDVASKGMLTRLHLALAMAIDAKLLVLN